MRRPKRLIMMCNFSLPALLRSNILTACCRCGCASLIRNIIHYRERWEFIGAV